MTALGRWGAELGHEHAEGLTLSGTALTFDTGVKRSGTRSFKLTSSAACTIQHVFTGVAGRGYYQLGHIYLPAATAYPGALSTIIGLNPSSLYRVLLTTAGRLQLAAGGVDVGSPSGILATDTWYRIELFQQTGSGASDDSAEFRLDGVTIASETNQTRGTAAPTAAFWGWFDDPGTSEVIHLDDMGLNDNQGSANNTWLGDTKVGASFPTADSAIGNWKNGAGGSVTLSLCVDNVPPVGVSTATSAGSEQIENATSAAANSYDATMQSYTTIGVGASDTVQCVIPVVEIGSSSITGADTLTHSVVSNPAIAGTTSSCDIVAGTYPASWNRFTGVITENPTVTKGTSPVMRTTKDVATTRINACCLMALVVAWTPVTAPTAQRYRSIMMVGD